MTLPTPYYEADGITIYHERKEMKFAPDRLVLLAFAIAITATLVLFYVLARA